MRINALLIIYMVIAIFITVSPFLYHGNLANQLNDPNFVYIILLAIVLLNIPCFFLIKTCNQNCIDSFSPGKVLGAILFIFFSLAIYSYFQDTLVFVALGFLWLILSLFTTLTTAIYMQIQKLKHTRNTIFIPLLILASALLLLIPQNHLITFILSLSETISSDIFFSETIFSLIPVMADCLVLPSFIKTVSYTLIVFSLMTIFSDNRTDKSSILSWAAFSIITTIIIITIDVTAFQIYNKNFKFLIDIVINLSFVISITITLTLFFKKRPEKVPGQ